MAQPWARVPTAPALAPADADSRVTGPDAVKFFERSGLPREVLAKVWANCDTSRRGFLDYQAFVKVWGSRAGTLLGAWGQLPGAAPPAVLKPARQLAGLAGASAVLKVCGSGQRSRQHPAEDRPRPAPPCVPG